MISSIFKPAVTRLITPVARFALRIGIVPNAVTCFGAIGVVVASLYFYPHGDLFTGTLVVFLFSLSDLFDGAMARISQQGPSRWGGFLDSTIDRVTDSAILVALALYLIDRSDPLAGVVLLCILTGLLIPYIRAKAESFAIACSGGIGERTERLAVAMLAIAAQGLGIPYALTMGIWLLALIGAVTVTSRMLIVKRAIK